MNEVNNPVNNQELVDPVNVMILGIVAAALSYAGYHPAGIIVGFIARNKVKKYLAENDNCTCNKVMIGSILSKVGIYLGFGTLAFITAYLVYFFSSYFLLFGLAFGSAYESFSLICHSFLSLL